MNTITSNFPSLDEKNIALEIDRQHVLASQKADEAVSHAVQAGKLLLQVKSKMRHGEFTQWVTGNLQVTPRQAQRYMAAAQGKPTPIRAEAKATPVSHLTESGGGTPSHAKSPRVTEGDFVPEVLGRWISNPAFRPAAGHWHTGVGEAGAFWVVPSLQYPACFHISKLSSEDANGDSFFDGTRQPVPGFMVERTLQALGLANPVTLEWTSRRREGLDRPFGEPEVAAAIGVPA